MRGRADKENMDMKRDTRESGVGHRKGRKRSIKAVKKKRKKMMKKKKK